MRLLGLATCVAVLSSVVVAGAQAGSASAARTRDCRTAGVTVVANAKVRVYYRYAPGGGRLYHACDVRRKRRRSLGYNVLGEGITRHVGLVGRHVTYEDVICERDGTCSATIYRLDVASNRLQIVTETTGPPVTDLEMSATRAVYWIRRTAEGYAVLRGVPGGEPQTLENGPGVQPGSLATAGSRAYWTTAGAARSFGE